MARIRIAPGLQATLPLAVFSPIWFAVLYWILSEGNPDFFHTVHPISGLGRVGQPLGLLWNIGGFLIPGVLIAQLGWEFRKQFRGSLLATAGWFSLFLSGCLLGMTGIFPNVRGHPDRWMSILHHWSGWGAAAAFLVAAPIVSFVVWEQRRRALQAFLPLVLVLGTLTYQVLGVDQWWLGQRVGVACYFIWIGCVGFLFSRIEPCQRSPRARLAISVR